MTIDEAQAAWDNGLLLDDLKKSGPYRIKDVTYPDQVSLVSLDGIHSVAAQPNDFHACDTRGGQVKWTNK